MVDRIEFYIVNYHLPSLDTEQNYDRFNVKTKPFEWGEGMAFFWRLHAQTSYKWLAIMNENSTINNKAADAMFSVILYKYSDT